MAGGGGVGTAERRTATFLFTDLEGSTRLLERLGDEYAGVLTEHWRILRSAATANGGVEFGAEGDAMFFAFGSAATAARAAVDAQLALASAPWPEGVGGAVKVRMGLHTGQARIVFGEWVGLALHHAARICAAGHGGQILVSPVTAALLASERPTGMRVEALGEYRLRDVTEPLAIGQLEHEGLPHAFPPLRTARAEVTNLRNALTTFVGRAAEITEVRRLVGLHRLVTITGPGGAGKTRLAYEAAGDAGPDFPDGVWVAELAPLSDATGVARAAATALGVPYDESTDGAASWTTAIRGKRLLLVLDNCEHVVGAAAALADEIRGSCPGVHLLVTSREALRVAGEQVWPVPPMGDAAVRLFADRAVLARPAFEVSAANEGAVRRICERLDGLPLAVELAAARVATLDVQEIEGRLDDRFRLLRRGGARTALPRQQTLQALVDWSHDLLDDQERRVFRRLGVFAGSFTSERAALVVGADDDAEDGIEQLVAKSLVVREDGPDGSTRYRLLETLREYAVARLEEAGESDAVRAAHLDAVASFAEEAGKRILGPEQRQWLDLLDAEWVDVERALIDGLERDPTRVLDAAGTIAPFFAIRGHVVPGRTIVEEALRRVAPVPAASRTEARAPWWARVRALAAAGTLARAANDLDAAGRHHLEQLELVRGDPDEELVAKALSSLGNVRLVEGRVEEARRLCEESLAIRRRLGTPRPLALALNNLGVLADQEGDYGAAEAAYGEHLAIMRELGDVRVTGQTLTNLALVHLATDRLDDAAAALDESLALLRSVGDTRSVGVTMSVQAGLLRRRGDLEAARALTCEALRILDDLGDLAGVGMALDNLATVLATAGDEAGMVAAARLLGATANLPIGPGERGRAEDEEVARAAAVARTVLGDAVFDAAFGAGASAPLADVVVEALATRLG